MESRREVRRVKTLKRIVDQIVHQQRLHARVPPAEVRVAHRTQSQRSRLVSHKAIVQVVVEEPTRLDARIRHVLHDERVDLRHVVLVDREKDALYDLVRQLLEQSDHSGALRLI